MDVLDAMIRSGISLSRILALGPLHPVTLDDLSFDRGMGIGCLFSCCLWYPSSS